MTSGLDKHNMVIDLLPLKDLQLSSLIYNINNSIIPLKAGLYKSGNIEILRKRKELILKRSLRKKIKKEREAQIVSDDTNPITSQKELQVIEATKAGVSIVNYIRIKHGSLGERFQKVYKYELNIQVIIIVRTYSREKEEYIIIKNFLSSDTKEKVHIL